MKVKAIQHAELRIGQSHLLILMLSALVILVTGSTSFAQTLTPHTPDIVYVCRDATTKLESQHCNFGCYGPPGAAMSGSQVPSTRFSRLEIFSRSDRMVGNSMIVLKGNFQSDAVPTPRILYFAIGTANICSYVPESAKFTLDMEKFY